MAMVSIFQKLHAPVVTHKKGQHSLHFQTQSAWECRHAKRKYISILNIVVSWNTQRSWNDRLLPSVTAGFGRYASRCKHTCHLCAANQWKSISVWWEHSLNCQTPGQQADVFKSCFLFRDQWYWDRQDFCNSFYDRWWFSASTRNSSSKASSSLT